MPQASAVASAPVARMRVKPLLMAQLPFERPRAEWMRSKRGWLVLRAQYSRDLRDRSGGVERQRAFGRDVLVHISSTVTAPLASPQAQEGGRSGRMTVGGL